MGKTLLITCDYPPVQGGISNYLWHLWSALPPEKVVILAPDAPGYGAWDRLSGQRTYRKPLMTADSYPEKLRQILMLLVHTLDVIRKEEIGVIHGGHGISSGVTCYLCRRLFGIPYYLYLHSGELQKYRTLGLPGNWFMPIFNNAQALVVSSRYTREEYEGYGVRNRFVVVTPGVDAAPYSHPADTLQIRQKHGLEGKKVILTVGRIVEMKGHDMLIRALPVIMQRVPGVAYLIVGTGPYGKQLEALAVEMGVREQVVFAGYVSRETLPAYYGCCDLFVQLSRDIPSRGNVEGFGIVFLEAAAAGKAVVAGKSGGTEEAVVHGETGYLVDPLSIKEISEAITVLLTNHELAREMGAQGLKRVCKQFRWEDRIEIIRSLL
jgi:phosphatidylinositol alpha-1,6-mannosyltransferase